MKAGFNVRKSTGIKPKRLQLQIYECQGMDSNDTPSLTPSLSPSQVCSESQRFEKLMEHFKNEDNNIDFMVGFVNEHYLDHVCGDLLIVRKRLHLLLLW